MTKAAKPQTVTTRTVTLELDAQDYRHLMGAIRRREVMGDCSSGAPMMPRGESNREGWLLAEICRAWAVTGVDGWMWWEGEPMDPDERNLMRKAAP